MKPLHFSITGEFITNAIQDLIRQNKYAKAFEAATMCMVTSEEISESEKTRLHLSLLLGHSKLQGISNEDGRLHEESPEKSLHELIHELLTRFDEKLQLLTQKEKQIDQLTLQRNYLLSCFQEDYPFSLQEYMEKFQEEWEEPFLSKQEAHELQLDNIIYPTNTGYTPGLSTAVSEYIERMTSDDEEDEDYGWLSPTGVFHPVPWGEHNNWAYEYLKTHFGYEDICTTKETDILCEKGWCLLHNPALGIAQPTTLKPLTEKQKDFLYEYYDKRNKPNLIREYCM